MAEWIRSQPDSTNPTGTLIEVNTGLSGTIIPGASGYAGSKLSAHRFMEFVSTGQSHGSHLTELTADIDRISDIARFHSSSWGCRYWSCQAGVREICP